MPRTPKVSVVMAAYNHAPFVADAIQSVLGQTFSDFEFLIADDGSSDSTAQVVGRFTDPRIIFTAHAVNRGACAVMSELIDRATGEHVAVMNSDDVWTAEKLARQVDLLDRHPQYAALFSRASYIGPTGAPLPADNVPFGRVFDQENRSQGGWLRQFFAAGNCLCHSSVLIRRTCYAEVGSYDNRFRQLPDLEMWIRLAKRYLFFVLEEPLVSLRVLGDRNASSYVADNVVRTSSEHLLIGMSFFDGVSEELLLDGFGDLLVFRNPPSDIHWDVEKALLFLAPIPDVARMHQLIGLAELFGLRRSRRHREVLEQDYRIDDLAFHRLSGNVDAFRPQPVSVRHRVDGVRGHALVEELVRRLRTRAAALAGWKTDV